ncbi:hypothetical protein B0H15DRAFT_485627 [Mycena belliarum]|uniref:Uncharacterized protein n=1 Tax=Mycena belliarum TaxID=1033014 RepID=A0AAD6U0A2_9AGAR|nr:hypothetical protein B0H15DRAFT_485627 [Mycena belliae]
MSRLESVKEREGPKLEYPTILDRDHLDHNTGTQIAGFPCGCLNEFRPFKLAGTYSFSQATGYIAISAYATQRLTFEPHARRWLTRSATWDIKLQTDAQTPLPLSLILPSSTHTLSHTVLPLPSGIVHSLIPSILYFARFRWSLSSSTPCRDCSLLHIASTPSPHRYQNASVSHMSSTTPPNPPSAQRRPPLVLRRFRSISLDGCPLWQA